MNKSLEELIRKLPSSKELLNVLIEDNILSLDELENAVIKMREASYIYWFSKEIKNASIEKLADALILTRKVETTYQFARDIKEAPIKPLAREIIRSKNAYYIYQFALNIKGAPIEELEEAIIDLKNYVHISLFAQNIKGANIEKLARAVINLNRPEQIYDFALNIKGAPTNLLTQAIINVHDAEYIYRFMCDIPGANLKILTKGIIETRNAQYIYQFALQSKQYLKELGDALIDIKDIEYIYHFIVNIDCTQGLIDAIIKSRNVYYIYSTAKVIKNEGYILDLARAIISINSASAIYVFARDTKMPIQELVEALIQIGDISFIFQLLIDGKTPEYNELLLKAILNSKNYMFILKLLRKCASALQKKDLTDLEHFLLRKESSFLISLKDCKDLALLVNFYSDFKGTSYQLYLKALIKRLLVEKLLRIDAYSRQEQMELLRMIYQSDNKELIEEYKEQWIYIFKEEAPVRKLKFPKFL